MNFVDFLVEEYELRKKNNPTFTLTMFATELHMSTPRLNQLLKGKIGLSPVAAEKVADILQFPTDKKNLFIAMVEAKHSRSQMQKKLGHRKLNDIVQGPSEPIDSVTFSEVKEWYTAAIFSLVHIKDFELTADWISNRLNISKEKAQESIDRLIRLGFFKQTGSGWERTTKLIHFEAEPDNKDIKDYNEQLLEKAKESIYSVPPEERELSAFIVSVKQEDFKWVQEQMDLFKCQIRKELMNRQGPFDRVYCMDLLYYPLDVKK